VWVASQILVLARQVSEMACTALRRGGWLQGGGKGLAGDQQVHILGVARLAGTPAHVGPPDAVALKGFRQVLRALSGATA
jgi:hypothetical protein